MVKGNFGREAISPSFMPLHSKLVTELALQCSHALGWVNSTPATRVNSTMLSRTILFRQGRGPAFLHEVAGECQGQLSIVLDFNRPHTATQIRDICIPFDK